MAFKTLAALSSLALSQSIMLEAEVNGTGNGQNLFVRGKSESEAGNCDCLSWADVYFKGKALCGRTNELYFLSKWGYNAAYAATEPITGLPHKVCYDFFKNFLTPSCLNVDLFSLDEQDEGVYKPMDVDDKAEKQWCYVSNACGELNGGQFGTNQQGHAQGAWHNLESTNYLSWKVCKAGKDPMLKYWPVPELIKAAEYSDVSISRLLRLALPAVSIGWGEATSYMEAVNAAYDEKAGITSLVQLVAAVPSVSKTWGARLPEVHAMLADIVMSSQPTLLDSPGHGDNFHVIEGRAVYEVKRTPSGNMAYLGGHFFKEFAIACILGCATGERRDAVDLFTQ